MSCCELCGEMACTTNPQPVNHNQSAKSKQLESESKLFDTQTILSPSMSDIDTLSKVKQMRNLADGSLFCGLRINHVLQLRENKEDTPLLTYAVNQVCC